MPDPPTSLAPHPIAELVELSATGVVLLWTSSAGGKFEDQGTGFFYRNGESRFLVTARHVLLDEKRDYRPTRVRFNLKTSKEDISKSREVTLDLWSNGKPTFRFAAEPIDLAAIPIPDSVVEGAYYREVVPDFAPPEEVFVSLGSEVLLVGFPEGFYDEANQLPIARRGSIASVYRVHFKGRPIFIVDAHLHSEMSGAPVFLAPTNTVFGRKGRFELRAGNVSFFLGVHHQGFDNLELHEVYYPDLVPSLTRRLP
jgi:hypothetical protein